MTTLQGIAVRLHPSLPPLLDDVSVAFAPGEMVAIVGANGSGKSTLARVAAGLVEPTAGTVSRASPLSPGIVLQDPEAQFVAETVEDDLAFGLENRAVAPAAMHAQIERLVQRTGLQAVRARDPRTLSGGQQQRVAIAGAVAALCPLLVLDEVTSMLDAPHRDEVWQLVRALRDDGVAIAWVTQRIEEAVRCDRVVALEHGRVVFDDTPAALVAQPDLVTRLSLGLPAAARIAFALAERGIVLPCVPLEPEHLVDLLVTGAR